MIDRTMTFREHFGDYQRQLFLVDHAGLPLDVVLDQLEILGGEVVPVLRTEMAARRARRTRRPDTRRPAGRFPHWSAGGGVTPRSPPDLVRATNQLGT